MFDAKLFRDYHLSVFQNYGTPTRVTRLKVAPNMADPKRERSLKSILVDKNSCKNYSFHKLNDFCLIPLLKYCFLEESYE